MKVGDKVILVSQGNEARYGVKKYDAVITKVARKFFYIESEQYTFICRERFFIDTLMQDAKGYCSNWVVYLTDKDYKDNQEVPKLIMDIKNNLKRIDYQQAMEILKIINT